MSLGPGGRQVCSVTLIARTPWRREVGGDDGLMGWRKGLSPEMSPDRDGDAEQDMPSGFSPSVDWDGVQGPGTPSLSITNALQPQKGAPSCWQCIWGAQSC